MDCDETEQERRIKNIYSRVNDALDEYLDIHPTLDRSERPYNLLKKLQTQGLTVTLEVEEEKIGMRWEPDE